MQEFDEFGDPIDTAPVRVVEDVTMYGDMQDLSVPLIQPVITETPGDIQPMDTYLQQRLSNPNDHRYVRVIGKGLIEQYTDQDSVTRLMQAGKRHKQYVISLTKEDRISDALVLVVDAVEGVTLEVERQLGLKQPMVVIINNLDRLILELRLPPMDAYMKLRHIVDRLDKPVLFAGLKYGFMFSCEWFSRKYNVQIPLWSSFYNPATGKFSPKQDRGSKRSFVHFVLEPLYKMFSLIITADKDSILKLTDTLGLKQFQVESMEPHSLLKQVLSSYFDGERCFIDSLVQYLPGPLSDSDEEFICVKAYKIGSKLLYFGRVMLDRLSSGQSITLGDQQVQVQNIYVNQQLVQQAYRHNWVMVDIGDVIPNLPKSSASSVVKVAIEPVNPTDMDKFELVLKQIQVLYTDVIIKTGESGEICIYGTGEQHLDNVLRDVRQLEGPLQIRVGSLSVAFKETVVDRCMIDSVAESADKSYKVTVRVKSIGNGDSGKWSCGSMETNLLLDEAGHDPSLRAYIEQGFRWATSEGPLCDEPMKGCMFIVTDVVADHPPPTMVIATIRQAILAGFMLSQPRLLEPVYIVEVETPQEAMQQVYSLINRRRGRAFLDKPVPASTMFIIRAYLPVMDSFGFSTDLYILTNGKATCHMFMHDWQLVPGDPQDQSVTVKPLKPAPNEALARDFLLKTRRRKGLTEDVDAAKYFSEEMLTKLALL